MVAELTVWSALRYLTEVEGFVWRDQDYVARNIIKIVKGIPFGGYCSITIGGKPRRFNQENGHTLLPALYRGIARKIGDLVEGEFSIIPIPNSEAVVGDRSEFRTLIHAKAIAAIVGSRANAVGSLRWREAKEKAHQGGSRNPEAHLNNLRVVEKPVGRVVLFDDVLTSGSQMIGACRRLAKQSIEPALGIVIGRTTHEQHDTMIGWGQETLALKPTRIDLNELLSRPISDW